MAAATLTAQTAAGDLINELRDLLQRHDGASTLEEARSLADEITVALRRARGRIGRLARKTETPAKKTDPEPEAAPEVKAPRAERTPSVTPPAAVPVTPTRTPAARPVSMLRCVITAAAVLSARFAARAARAIRRTLALLTRRRAADPVMPLPRPADAPPLCATKRSPLDVSVGLQARKRQDPSAYRDTVLLWELGTRAHQGLETVR